jgi:hypothetical protein
MSFEDAVGQVNATYFFREFTFSTNTFRPNPKAELELADKVVWLDSLLIVFQVKERNTQGDTTAANERKWFTDEVEKKATRQIRNTLSYLKKYPQIEIRNNRGHAFDIATAQISNPHKLVTYNPHKLLPTECAFKKFHRSKTAGIIHLIPSAAYLGILDTLVTPAEIGEYLSFREALVNKWEDAVSTVSEKALVGQYLRNLPEEHPDTRFVEYVDLVGGKQKDWDISPIINLFLERKTTANPLASDYDILKQLAKLYRTDMAEFRTRWQFSMRKALDNESSLPHRFTASTGCGFVFIPMRREDLPNRENALVNFTALNKYDQKLDRCIGLTFIAEGSGSWCDVHWSLMEFIWTEDAKIQALLDDKYPFRPVKEQRIERYGLLNTI